MFSCCCAYSERLVGPDPVCECHTGACPPRPTTAVPAELQPRRDDPPLSCCESCAEDFARNGTLSYYRFAMVLLARTGGDREPELGGHDLFALI